MSEPLYSILLTARVLPVFGAVGVGDALVYDSTLVSGGVAGWFVKSTSAARTSSDSRSQAVALTAYGGPAAGTVTFQSAGPLAAEVSGLAATTAGLYQLVRVSTTGRLERVASYSSGDDIVGYAYPDGRVALHIGLPWSSIADVSSGLAATLTGYGNSSGVLTGSRRGIPIEFFGGVGDDSTDNAAAFLAAIAAYNAGTYGSFTLVLGDGIYRTAGMDRSVAPGTPRWPYGMGLVGNGPTSVVKLTATTNFILMQDTDAADRAKFTTFANFHVVGTASGHYGTGGGSDQNAIEIGFVGSDGASRGLVHGVSAYRLRGRLFSVTNVDALSYGWRLVGCLAEDCLYGYYLASASDVVDCQATYCGTGVRVNGNTQCVAMSLENCSVGIDVIAGGNDAHGTFQGRLVHCTIPIRVGAITNGFTFPDCLLFEGEIDINGSVGEVAFVGGQIDATTYSLNGTTSWRDVQIGAGYYSSSSTSSGANRFVECYDVAGLVPAWVGALMQPTFTFAADANETLTSQVSIAQTLVVAAGVISAARQITNARTPAKGGLMRVVNNNANDVTFKWATGTAVTVAAGAWALVGADGTNAIKLEAGTL